MGILTNMKSFLSPKSGLKVKHNKLVVVQRNNSSYWTQNSIYLDNIYNKIATDVALMKFKHLKIEKVINAPDKLTHLADSSLQEVVSLSPNALETPINFWSNVVREMLKNGIAVVIPIYKINSSDIDEIVLAQGVMNYDNMKINIQINNEVKTVNVSDVWIFENPKTNISSQLRQMTKLIDDNLKALSEKIEGNSLKGLLKLSTSVDDKKLQAYAEERANSILESAKNSQIGYLGQNEEFQELNNVYHMADKEQMEFIKQQLYNAFGLNDDLFTCNYNEDQYRAYFQSIIKLYTRVISEEINRKYFTKTARTQGQRLLIYIDMFDIASLKDLNDFAFKQKYMGNMNSNEIREIFGYGAYVGGEVYESNRNQVQLTPMNNNENNEES